MADDEPISRRELFSGWSRGFAEGVARWVVPMVEQRLSEHQDLVRQLQESIGGPPEGDAHPWRDLLMPPDER
ncbi:MAG TPA: hypothetical protein VOB72_01720 [Candidatus Dormibacteraeota bacterium]|nr:hypothetical protein [Candidatus Dormibacteraeota bacterium]